MIWLFQSLAVVMWRSFLGSNDSTDATVVLLARLHVSAHLPGLERDPAAGRATLFLWRRLWRRRGFLVCLLLLGLGCILRALVTHGPVLSLDRIDVLYHNA